MTTTPANARKPTYPEILVPTETHWNNLSLERAERLLAEVGDSFRAGSRIVANRIGHERTNKVERCIVCRKVIPQRIEHGRQVFHPIFMFTARNQQTGIEERHSICTQHCYMQAVRRNLIRPPGGMTPFIAAPPERSPKTVEAEEAALETVVVNEHPPEDR